MNEDQTETYRALSQKRVALVTFLQVPLTAANTPILQPAIGPATLELALVNSTITELLHGAPISFPSRDELDRIRKFSGAISVEVETSNDFAALVTKALALINTWPG